MPKQAKPVGYHSTTLSLFAAAIIVSATVGSSEAPAQSSPEVIFRVGHLSGDCSSTPTMGLLATGSRSDGGTLTQGSCTYIDSSSASVSSGSLSMSTSVTAQRAPGATGCAQCGGYGFEIYTLHPANMTLVGGGSASGSFSGGSGGLLSYGPYPINAGTYGLSQTSGQSGSSSSSSSTTVNLSCSTSPTTFSEYPGVNYYRAFQSNGLLYKLSGTATLGGTGEASATIEGSGSVSVQYASSVPVAVIGPAEPGGMAEARSRSRTSPTTRTTRRGSRARARRPGA